jgi:phosphatidylserine synthase
MDKDFWTHVDALSHKIATFAPVAYEKLLLLTQLKSAAHLGIGGVDLLISVIFMICAWKAWKTFNAKAQYDDFPGLPMALSAGIVIFGLPAAIQLFNMWNWIGAFVPEARLINDVWDGLVAAKNAS